MEAIIMIDYTPMWEYMSANGISQYYLIKHGIDNKTIYNLKKNENITLLTLEKLCQAMNCTPNDIVRFIEWYIPQLLSLQFYSCSLFHNKSA